MQEAEDVLFGQLELRKAGRDDWGDMRYGAVGRTSTGNVEVQWQVDFEGGSRVWLASETFRPPSGADWEKSGIVPDLEIPLSWDEFTSEDDPQLDAAVEWLLQELNK